LAINVYHRAKKQGRIVFDNGLTTENTKFFHRGHKGFFCVICVFYEKKFTTECTKVFHRVHKSFFCIISVFCEKYFTKEITKDFHRIFYWFNFWRL